jgi:hypothetical protein
MIRKLVWAGFILAILIIMAESFPMPEFTGPQPGWVYTHGAGWRHIIDEGY